jgi:hypothetical protein
MIKTTAAMIYPGEVVLSSRWVEQQSDTELLASIRMFTTLSQHPFLTETHCGGLMDFNSIEEFYEAAQNQGYTQRK